MRFETTILRPVEAEGVGLHSGVPVRIRILPASVRVSGRRFLARPVFYFLAVNLFPALYALGVPPAALKKLYGDPR